MRNTITTDEMELFRANGYVRLGRLLDDSQLSVLSEQINHIMLGTADVPYDQMMMMLEPSTNPPKDLEGQSKGHKLSTLDYRKIQDLELSPQFHAYLSRPFFANLCTQVYGQGKSVACMRAMFLNKPAGGGTELFWHQDRWSWLDRDPKITVWTALDTATIANGCVEIVPRSHRHLINASHMSGFLSDKQRSQLNGKITSLDPEIQTVNLELEAGEAVLLHNWTLHRSGTNKTSIPRRAFSVCYMDNATRHVNGDSFRLIFDEDGQAVPPEAV